MLARPCGPGKALSIESAACVSSGRHRALRSRRGRVARVCRALPDRLDTLVKEWLQQDADEASKQQIEQLQEAEDVDALQELLGQRLQFGTAGLRGLMGPGYNRMNAVTVQQTTQGLLRYLRQQAPERLSRGGVAIGYDGRHGSRRFAHIVAACALAEGVPAWLFSELVPTPFVPAAVEQLGCAGGVMVTASHNPAAYNGYKVYLGNACQVVPPHDAGIAAAIEQQRTLWALPPLRDGDGAGHPLLRDPLPAVAERYYERLARKLRYRDPAANAAAPPLVYTALHGVGTPWVQRAFRCFGLPQPLLVGEQCEPHPDFPTVPFPNPEEGRGAWRLALQAAEDAGARLAFANDPDADRFAVAERDPQTGEWRTFTGNEIGGMLAEWVLYNYRQRRQGGGGKERLAMLSSCVSSRWLESMTAAEGVHWEETLTGFKWLGNVALQLEAEGYTVLFAFEEAIGFMLGQLGHDKDGVAAAAVCAELAAALYAQGSTLAQHWDALQRRYGRFEYRSGYFVSQPPSRSAAVFQRLRDAPPAAIAGQRVVAVRDLGTGLDTSQPDGRAVLPWQPGDLMITYSLAEGLVTLRASGTEPKLKFYLEAWNREKGAAAPLADALAAAVEAELVQPQQHGLTRPQL